MSALKKYLFGLLLLTVACGESTPQVSPSVPPANSGPNSADIVNSLSEELDNLKETLAERREQREQEAAQPVPEPEQPIPENSPSPVVNPVSQSLVTPSICKGLSTDDLDQDGITDACENVLAKTYAPIYYYSQKETVFPTTVKNYLQSSSLWFFDNACRPDVNEKIQEQPDFKQLLSASQGPDCGHASGVNANRTRSKEKARTFYLENVPEELQTGSSDASSGEIYIHVYPNTLRGVTLQYWTFYAYDDDNNHGGDWEGFHIVLDSQFKPNRVTRLSNEGLTYTPWSQIEKEGNRPRLYVVPESHILQTSASGIKSDGCGGIGGFFSCGIELDNADTFVRYDSADILTNMGERTHPNAEQPFIQYSGLWGNATGGLFKDAGDWGPAYQGKGLEANGFIAAWADKMITSLATFEEAFPQEVSP